jgi:hypothetical protein
MTNLNSFLPSPVFLFLPRQCDWLHIIYCKFYIVLIDIHGEFAMMMDEADSEQVFDVPDDVGDVSSGGEEEGEEMTGTGGSDQQNSEVDDSVLCFTGHSGTVIE